MSKKDFLSLIVVLVLALFVALYYFRDVFQSVDGDPWMLVSEQAALVIELDKPGLAFSRLLNENSIGASLKSASEVQNLIESKEFLDSLLVDANPALKKVWQNRMLVSFVFDSVTSQTENVLISQTGSYIGLEDLQYFLGQKLGAHYAVLAVEIEGKTGLKIISGQNEKVSYLFFTEGNLLYSASQQLIAEALLSAEKGSAHFSAKPNWQKLRTTIGKHVDARVHIQYKQLAPWLASVASAEMAKNAAWLAGFADWTETDLIIKKDELLLAGFTSFSSSSFLAGFHNQQPIKTKFYNITPFNVNLVLNLSFSNFLDWFEAQHGSDHLARISATFNFDMQKLIAVVGSEVALVSNGETPNSFEGSLWVLVNTTDATKMAAYLRRIAENTGNTKIKNYNHHVIHCITGSSFLPDLFGSVFPDFNKNYYTLLDDFVVFAQNESSLINLIRYYETGKTLDLNDNFKVFSDNLAPESNILLYFKPGNLMGRVTDFVSRFTSRKLQINDQIVSQLQGVAFQFATGKDLSFSNFYLKHATVVHEENLATWKVLLDNEIIHKPILVNNHRDNDQNILVFDNSPSVYLIDSDGNTLWKQRLSGMPFGDIYEVDYYKNKKVQYLFNTNTHLYLLDIEGHSVAAYPKKLHLESTNPLSVFDYSGRKDYRLLVAQANKKVNNFSVDGYEVDGWNNPHMQNVVNEPVNRLVINGKDYIIITDIDGKAKIVDRKGNDRISVAGKFTKARNSGYYVNRTNSKGIIITTNTEGKLIYISASGKLKTTDFGSFSPDHFFLYEDFNGDGTMDFIYVDGRNLKVYDRFKKVLFNYTFNSEITIKPDFFNLGRKEKVMGVVANAEKTIYLFDSKGNTIISTGLVGETPFTVGSVGNDRKINLISAAGNTLYNYRIK